ncbi:MAG TPA: phosphatidate cytidylyltransferase [Vicinamibacterales bacterium]|nr:phosphatidate cytidylyltransferase [Vicinamibacterales bacterium]
MLRILSAAVLVPVVVVCIWFLPGWLLLLVAEAVLLLGFVEYARLAEGLGARIPRAVSAAGAVAACAAVGLGTPVELPLLATLLVVGAVLVGSRSPDPRMLGDAGAALLPSLYLGLPLGSLVALHAGWGREAVLLLLLAVVASDTAQYYAGRLLGRRQLSPRISPKKTLEGALGGFLVAPPLVVLAGRAWLPWMGSGHLWLISLALVGLGIVGDLFESLLKRSAGVKDSSALIPGHGGVLDRIDGLLFAAPAFYLFLRYAV